jgi:hypothetical protein
VYKTQQFFTDKEAKDHDSVAGRRFRDAKYEFCRLSLDAQVAWMKKVLKKYPRLEPFIS